MKNMKIKAEIYSLEKSVLRIVDQSKILASTIGTEQELLEELRQIAIALYYTVQTLMHRLDLVNAPGMIVTPTKYYPDSRVTAEIERLLLKTESNRIAKPK